MRRGLRIDLAGEGAAAEPVSCRKPAGWLADAIVIFLRDRGPATANGVAVALRQEFPRLATSAVFIAMKRLHRRGVVQRVECTKSYLVAERDDPIHLVCGVCGGHAQTADQGLVTLLKKRSAEHGLGYGRLVLEVVGVCDACVHPGGAAADRVGPAGGSSGRPDGPMAKLPPRRNGEPAADPAIGSPARLPHNRAVRHGR